MAHSIRLAAGAIGILAAMAGPAYAQTYYGNLPLIYDDQPSDLLIPFSPEYGGREQGYSNTGFGALALYTEFFGYGSDFGYVPGSGTNNVAMGASALTNDAAGTDGTALGFNTLVYNGYSGLDALVGNTAVGSGALYNNSDGDTDVAVGFQALANHDSGSDTTTGWQALVSDTSGYGNTAFGSSALAFSQAGWQRRGRLRLALSKYRLEQYRRRLAIAERELHRYGQYRLRHLRAVIQHDGKQQQRLRVRCA